MVYVVDSSEVLPEDFPVHTEEQTTNIRLIFKKNWECLDKGNFVGYFTFTHTLSYMRIY